MKTAREELEEIKNNERKLKETYKNNGVPSMALGYQEGRISAITEILERYELVYKLDGSCCK